MFIDNWFEFYRFGIHGIYSKGIITNSSRNRKMDLPSIRHTFCKIIRIVLSKSDEENSFRNIVKEILVIAYKDFFKLYDTSKYISFTLEY